MDRKSFIVLALFGLLVGAVIAFMFMKPVSPQESNEATEDVIPPVPPTVKSNNDQPQESAPQPTAAVIKEKNMTSFMKSEIADKWMKELGYTLADIAEAQQKIRELGMSEDIVNDPGVIQRHIKPRHIGNVSTEEIMVPSEAKAGQPIPFTLKGTAPSPTFQFTRFDILVQGDVIRIRAIGNSDADNDAGLGETVMLNGEIDPLPPGHYRIEVPELGPMGSFKFTVSP